MTAGPGGTDGSPAELAAHAPEFGVGTDGALANARALHRLALTPELAARTGQLQSLARALEGSGDAETWSGIDLHRALALPPAPVTPPADDDPRSVRLLEAARTALVFAPLAITWAGLWSATGAYSDLVRSGSADSGLSFFRLWQTDFGGRLSYGFEDMALTTLVALALLVAVTLLLAVVRREPTVETPDPEVARRELLTVALTDAALHLAQMRNGSPERLRSEFTKAARSFGRLVHHVEAGGRVVEEALEGLRGVVDDLGQAADAVQRSNAATAAAATGLDASVTRFQPAVETALRQFEHEARSAAEGLANHVRRAELGHEALLHQLLTATGDASTSLHDLVESSTSWTVGAATNLVDAVTDLRGRVETVGDHLAIVVSDHTDRVGELEEQATQNARLLLDAVARLGGDLASLTAGLPALARGVDRLHAAVPQLDRSLDRLATSTPGVQQRLDDVLAHAPTLTARFDALLAALPTVTQQLAGVTAAAPRLADELAALAATAPALTQHVAALHAARPGLAQPLSAVAAGLPFLVQSTDELQEVSRSVTQACHQLRTALDTHGDRLARAPQTRDVMTPVDLPEAS